MKKRNRKSSQKIGRVGEEFAVSILEKITEFASPAPVIVPHGCDIMQGKTAIEVKTSNIIRRFIPYEGGKGGSSWYGYRFYVRPQLKTAHFFFLVLLGEDKKPLKAFNIPAFLMPNCTTLDIHQKSTKWDDFQVFPVVNESEQLHNAFKDGGLNK